MQTVIETPAFLASAKDEGIPDEERQEIVTYIAKHPSAGDLMPGTGGARKVRFAGRSKGKSGGYRVITFYAAEDLPVFLLDIYSKDTQANLSKAERNELRKILTELPKIWRENVGRKVRHLRREK
ncbi:type II toxin-antitoxin system RelE/ParE family toxin [Rhizobium giardinii]|uniref:type II toxin-antitoxin system RelE/ParE family toxin n=1 Tax=Rhizobium giardinii TaxID=56731 RepID=UPI003D6EE236